MNTRFLFLSLFMVVAACSKDDVNNPEINQQVLFQVEYINFAWGFQHSGILIDSSGRVWSYRMPDKWNYPDSRGYIGSDEMEENLQHLDSVLFLINHNTLIQNYSKLIGAANGRITEPRHEMCDAGAIVYSGYKYEPGAKRYKRILIRQWGDFFIENRSPEADELYQWLHNLVNQRK